MTMTYHEGFPFNISVSFAKCRCELGLSSTTRIKSYWFLYALGINTMGMLMNNNNNNFIGTLNKFKFTKQTRIKIK